MNPYLIIAALAAVLAAGAGGFKLGADHEVASQARAQEQLEKVIEATTAATAEAISKIKVVNRTIQNEVRHETSTQTVYRDNRCAHTDNGLRLANQALDPAGSFAVGGGKLPKADATVRP